MTTTMQLAIETYSNLTGRNFQEIFTECLNGNKVIIENIQKLMFAAL
jgi:hypothetical protein